MVIFVSCIKTKSDKTKRINPNMDHAKSAGQANVSLSADPLLT